MYLHDYVEYIFKRSKFNANTKKINTQRKNLSVKEKQNLKKPFSKSIFRGGAVMKRFKKYKIEPDSRICSRKM